MLILAFDTSGMHGSVALLDGPNLLAEQALPTDRRSAQTLAPAIVEVLASQHIEPKQIQLVATTIGPGSFTGLRVGITAAKTFAYAVGAELLGFSTLEAIAHNSQYHQPGPNLVPDVGTPNSTGSIEIHAVLDAQRKELFVGKFLRRSADHPRQQPGANLLPEPRECVPGAPGVDGALPVLTRLADDCIVPADDWLASLQPGTIVAGSGLDRLQDRLPAGLIIDSANGEPRAAIVGQLAWRDYQSGRRDDLWKLAPLYFRPSYAEEKARRSPS